MTHFYILPSSSVQQYSNYEVIITVCSYRLGGTLKFIILCLARGHILDTSWGHLGCDTV